MTTTTMRHAAYLAIGLNGCSALALANFMMSPSWTLNIVIISAMTMAAYHFGHEFASGKRVLKRKALGLALVVYIAAFAMPSLKTSAPILAYLFARLLMFHAITMTNRREAYLHLATYLVVITSCFGSGAAGWSLLPFLAAYFITLVAALALLHHDHVPSSDNRPSAPIVGSMLATIAGFIAGFVLFLIIPLTAGPDIQFFPQHRPKPGVSENGSLSHTLDAMANGPASLNGDTSGLDAMMQRILIGGAGISADAEAIIRELNWPPPWLPLLLALAIWLWMMRHRLWLGLQVLWLDPWRLKRLRQQPTLTPDAPAHLYAAFERLWAYHDIPRHHAMTPLEHASLIEHHFILVGHHSRQLIRYFSDWRYGQSPPYGFDQALERYAKIRIILRAVGRSRDDRLSSLLQRWK